MSIVKFTIAAQAVPELPERVMRVARHRGFSILEFRCLRSEVGFQIELTTNSEREPQQLFTQLQKLINITHCEFASV